MFHDKFRKLQCGERDRLKLQHRQTVLRPVLFSLIHHVVCNSNIEERARARYDSRDVTSHFGFRPKLRV